MVRLALTLILLALWGCKNEEAPKPPAQEPPAAPSADAGMTFDVDTTAVELPHTGDIREPLLWRVKGPNGPSWLFGSFHGGVRASWNDLPPRVRKAFEKSEYVVFETDTQQADPAAVAKMLALPEGKSLRAGLGEERFQKLVEFTGHPPEVLDRYRPWVVHGELVSRWIGDEQPVDAWMLEHAQSRKKKLDYLDTMQKQLEMLDGAITFEVLQKTLDDLDEQERTLVQASQAYKEGDVASLRQNLFSSEDVTEYRPMYDTLFKKRNRRWLSEILQHVERGNAFIVVGAGHLIGPDNLVDMLREEGISVEQ